MTIDTSNPPILPPTLLAPLRAMRMSQPQERVTAAHRHASGQLFGAERGLLSVAADRGQWVVPASHCVWMPPHHVHALRSHGPFAGWSVYVDEASCGGLPAAPCVMRVSGLLREAVDRASSWGDGVLDARQARVAGVILDEIAAAPHEPFGLPLPTDPRLVRVARAVLDDLADERGVEVLAAWAGVSPRTLARRFTIETGFTPSAWRQRARILRALELLAAGQPVTTIALDLGYDTVSAFIAMFRRVMGVTPGRYGAMAG
ncbi:helix-turn-helix domain-containing protein [Janthinobacterium sp. SUN137]|uniref:AraC family transcriptional regulator n=1 Tax=Janthinobacterium sp. SUN137 TaxID=3014789 RepID=UPI0027133539|nr:helix-turn-helix transcriptional regulator [Janthinobacterium sp. SUN137]MDO8041356.1 helix-turn-helix transcriptional regulator [Janthinobacterium sp. SUN137]